MRPPPSPPPLDAAAGACDLTPASATLLLEAAEAPMGLPVLNAPPAWTAGTAAIYLFVLTLTTPPVFLLPVFEELL